MNPEFEQKVSTSFEQSLSAIQPQPPVAANQAVPVKSRKASKKIIAALVIILMCCAVFIILRAVFLQNPPMFDNNSIIGKILNPNGVTELNGLEITQAQSIINDFTKTLKQEYQDLPSSEDRTLLIKTSNSSIVGKLNKAGAFSKLSEIPTHISIYKFYQEDTFLYAINIPNSSQSELYLSTPGNKPVLIRRLDRNQKFINAHFSLSDKSFYYSFFDANNTIYIQATDLKGVNYDLYKTNFLKTNASIWRVDTTAGYIYLNQNRECFSLQLRDKILNPYACEKIKSNNGNNFYWSNESETGLYTSYSRGEIYRFTYGELERKILATKSNGQVVQNLWLNGDTLYYILGELKTAGSSLWSFQPLDIMYVNTSATAEGRLNLRNVRSDINSIIVLNDLYIITEEFFGKAKLYKYNHNPTFPEPISYPSSFPSSYSVEEIKEEDYYWEEVDLGFNYDTLEVLQPQYTFNF